MPLTFKQVHDNISARVATVSGFVAASQPLDPRAMPAQVADKMFSIALETENTEELRDRKTGSMYVEHAVELTFLRQLAVKDQLTTYADALDNEDAILQALLTQSGSWQQSLHMRYRRSLRDVIAAGAWLRVRMRFECKHIVELT